MSIPEKIIERIGPAVLLPIPSGEKGPKLAGWQKLTLADMKPEYLVGLNHGNNIGVLLGAASGGLVTVDCDDNKFLEEFLAVNPGLRESLISKGARGGNVWARIKGSFPKSAKIKLADGSPWGEFRADGMQTVIYGKHPTGKAYDNNRKKPAVIEFAAIRWPAGLRSLPWIPEPAVVPVPSRAPNGGNLIERARAYVDRMPPAIAGSGGHDRTFAVCKAIVHDFALSDADAWAVLSEYNARCLPPWSEKELRHKLADAANCTRANRGRGELADTDRPSFKHPPTRCEFSEQSERTGKGRGDSSLNSLCSHPVEAPKLAEDAMFGLPGSVVRKIEPHTETHPAALLLQLLIGFGNLVGRKPFLLTERDHQHTNLFGVIVGESSRGRKGTSWGHIRFLLEQADAGWEQKNITSGLASGEGVITELKDAEEGEETPPKDKRLLLMESEFGSVLRVMQREGSTVSALIRNAWDTGTLRNLANKNRDKSGKALRATDTHVSLIGHITKAELSKLLDENDSSNGFANRFLWVHSSRTKLLPDGGEIQSVDFSTEIKMLKQAVQLAHQRGQMKRTPEARDYWHAIYPTLTQDHPGRWGQVTSRAEAQVVRLALVFALLDGGEHIGLPHLKAAHAVWNYCSASAQWAFMESRFSRPAGRILNILEQGPLTLKQISCDVFQRHASTAEIEGYIREIESLLLITKQPTGGRDATIISLRAQPSETPQAP